MSETAEVVTKRSNGIARIKSAAAAAAALATTRGRGAPRSTQASRRIRNSGATANVLRSWIRSANCEANVPTTSSVQNGEGDRRREQHLQRPVERARPRGEDDRGRDGDDAEVEIELRGVVDDEVRRLAEVVVPVADDHRVRAEQRAQRHPARGLGDDDEQRAADERSRRATGTPTSSTRKPPRWNRARRIGAVTAAAATTIACDRVRYASPSAAKKSTMVARRGPLEQRDERERGKQEDRVVGVLRHHRGRVDHRRHGDREQRREQRRPLADDPPGDEVGGHGGERHDQAVDRLDRGVDVRDPVEDRVRGGDQDRDRRRRSRGRARPGRRSSGRRRSSSPSPSR